MALQFRPPRPDEYPAIEEMVIASFAPITWMKKLDSRIGPLNGEDWHRRWKRRMAKVFETQHMLIGIEGGELVAFASGTIDEISALGLVDLLAVRETEQSRGHGRETLRAIMDYFRQHGCLYVNLECLTDNAKGNALYESEGFVEVARHVRWFRPL